jgi:hypothetical protein
MVIFPDKIPSCPTFFEGGGVSCGLRLENLMGAVGAEVILFFYRLAALGAEIDTAVCGNGCFDRCRGSVLWSGSSFHRRRGACFGARTWLALAETSDSSFDFAVYIIWRSGITYG